MSDSHRLSFRLPPALQAALTAHVRQRRTRASDVVREALEAYLGLGPTERPPAQGPVSDIVSDVAAMVETLLSDMADLRSRLERLEAHEAQLPRVRQRSPDAPATPPPPAPSKKRQR